MCCRYNLIKFLKTQKMKIIDFPTTFAERVAYKRITMFFGGSSYSFLDVEPTWPVQK